MRFLFSAFVLLTRARVSFGYYYRIPLVNRTSHGELMRNISRCHNDELESNIRLNASNIHILILATPNFLESFQFHLESIRIYCGLHGYSLRVINPENLLKLYGLKYMWTHDWKPFAIYREFPQNMRMSSSPWLFTFLC